MKLRFLYLGIFGLLLAMVFLAALFLALLQTQLARSFLADGLSKALSSDPHRQVIIGKVEGFLPFVIRFKQVDVNDSEGRWLLAEGIVLRWAPTALLGGTIRVREVSASRIVVHRLPKDPGRSSSGEPSSFSFQLPGGLPAFALESISVPDLTFAEGVTGRAAGFALTGDLSRQWRSGGLNGTLSIRRIDEGPETRVDIVAGITEKPSGTSIQAVLTEGSDGFLAQLAGFANAGSIDFRIDGKGSLSDWRGLLHLAAERFGSLQGGVQIRGGETVVLELNAAIHRDLDLALPGCSQLIGSEASLELTISRGSSRWVVLERGGLVAEALTIDATGQLDPTTMETSVRSAFHIEDLRSLAPLLGREVSGRADLLLTVDTAGKLGQLKGILSGETNRLGGLPDYLSLALGQRPRMEGHFFLEEAALLHLPSLRVTGSGFSVEAEGMFNMRTRDARGRVGLSVPDLGILSKSLGKSMAGTMAMTADLEMLGDEQKYSADFSGREFILNGDRFPGIKGRLEGTGTAGIWKGGFSLQADGQRERLAFSGAYALQKDEARLTDLNLAAPGTSLQANLFYRFSEALILGEIDGRFTDLASLGRFVGLNLKGRGQLRGKLSKLKERQRIELSANGKGIGTPWGEAGEIALTADLLDPLRQPGGRAELSLRQFKAGDLEVHSLSLKSSGNGKDLGFSANAQGKARTRFSVETEGSLSWVGEEARVRLSSLKGLVGKRQLQLDRPLLVSRTTEKTVVSAVILRSGVARLEGDGTLGKDRVTVNARLVGLPLDMLSEMGMGDMQGTANGTLSMDGSPSNPSGELRLSLSDVRMGIRELKNVPPASVLIQLTIERDVADARLEVEGVFPKPARARVNLPVQFSLQPVVFKVSRERGLQGSLEMEADLASLMSLYPQEEHKLGGAILADLKLEGSLASPNLGGAIAINRGRYENWSNGTVLDAVSLRMAGKGKRLEIEEFRATDGEKGRMEGSGWIQLDDVSLPLDLSITMTEATLLRREDLRGSVTGNIALSGSLGEMVVTGNLRSGPSEFNITKRPPPAVSKLDVIEINKPDGHKEVRRWDSKGSPGQMGFGLTLEVPQRFHVRGGGLESEWSGNIKVSGDSVVPLLSGRLECIRGHFDFLDKRFRIVMGVIELDGSHPPSPRLDLTAEARGKEILARIKVSGSASSPTIALESDPQMPQDEILSNLLFGRTLSSINPMQAVRLAQAVKSLSGGDGGLGVVDKVRRLLGADQLGFREAQEKESKGAFGIGKYITDDIYVDVQKDIGGKAGKATIDVELTPNISVQGQAGTDASTGIGLNWKRDY